MQGQNVLHSPFQRICKPAAPRKQARCCPRPALAPTFCCCFCASGSTEVPLQQPKARRHTERATQNSAAAAAAAAAAQLALPGSGAALQQQQQQFGQAGSRGHLRRLISSSFFLDTLSLPTPFSAAGTCRQAGS